MLRTFDVEVKTYVSSVNIVSLLYRTDHLTAGVGLRSHLQTGVSVPCLRSLTGTLRHQVHQAALLPAAGDGPLLPHVLEHLPPRRGLRLHR